MARAATSFPEFAKRQEALALKEVDKAERDHFWRNCRGAFGDSRLRTSPPQVQREFIAAGATASTF
jgi:hypothetical protein